MTTISARQAIRNAIEAELAAARFYRLLAESTQDAESRAFLFGLADLEIGHAEAIEKNGRDIVDGPLPARPDGRVDMIETVPEWRFADNLTFDQALDMALAAERQAAMYYDAFSDQFEGPAKQFFGNLSKTETEHAASIEERRSSLRR
jgi:rubrerythrin